MGPGLLGGKDEGFAVSDGDCAGKRGQNIKEGTLHSSLQLTHYLRFYILQTTILQTSSSYRNSVHISHRSHRSFHRTCMLAVASVISW
jgi:hypothetical protein